MNDNLSIEDINKKIQELEYDIENNNVDISMSNNVNELDIDFIKKDKVINSDNVEKFEENIDLDEILYNEEISNNDFIKYISDNSNLDNDPYISTINSYFCRNMVYR